MATTLRFVVYSLAAAAMARAADIPSFEKTVAPVLAGTCAPCHNENLASGNVDLGAYGKASSLTENREGWDVIMRKLRAGEMPPKGVPRPPTLDAVIQWVQAELDKADRSTKQDPGRVTARRL